MLRVGFVRFSSMHDLFRSGKPCVDVGVEEDHPSHRTRAFFPQSETLGACGGYFVALCSR
jgi:hypothetical protein